MLEVIDKGSCSESHPVPLLFVHGAWHAAWCWDEHFLDFFADKGYRSVAMSLRGHGGSPTPKPLHNCSIADYIDDVNAVAQSLPARPVVIGHSMGGFVVQRYLEAHDAPAGVLIASMPPRGVVGFLARYAKQHPWRLAKALITGESSAMFNTPDTVREKFFCPQSPESKSRTAPLRYRTRADELRSTRWFSTCPAPSVWPHPCWCSARNWTTASLQPKCVQQHVHTGPKQSSSPKSATMSCSSPDGLTWLNAFIHGSERGICGSTTVERVST